MEDKDKSKKIGKHEAGPENFPENGGRSFA